MAPCSPEEVEWSKRINNSATVLNFIGDDVDDVDDNDGGDGGGSGDGDGGDIVDGGAGAGGDNDVNLTYECSIVFLFDIRDQKVEWSWTLAMSPLSIFFLTYLL